MSNLTITALKSRRLPSFLTKGLNNLTQSYQLARDTVCTTSAILRKRIKARQGLRNFVKTFYKQLQNTTSSFDDSLIFNYEKASITIKILEDIWDSIDIGDEDKSKLKNKSFINLSSLKADYRAPNRENSIILVTGANGFLGKNLVEALLKKGNIVRVVIRKINKQFEENENIEVIYGDLRNPEVIEKAVKGVDIVYHCAALTTNKGPWRSFQENNIEATRNLLIAAEKAALKKFVFVSSVVVYGFNKDRGKKYVSENDEFGRGLPFYSYYAKSKIEAERLLWEFYDKKKLPVVVLRPGIIFGAKGGNAFKIKKIIFGAKGKILPYIYVKDVVNAIILAGDKDAAIGNAYNLVMDEQPTQGEFNKIKSRVIGVQKVGSFLPRAIMFIPAYLFEFVYRKKKPNVSPPFNMYHYKSLVRNLRYDNQKIKNELGWLPSYSVEDALRESFESSNN
jgi:nucleoside-diphosphate-sugar epimerase